MKKEIVTPRGTFAYRSYGTVGNPTLILVHGWPQNSYCWNEIAQHLTPYHIIAPDLRGLGDSERTLAIDAYSKDQLGLDIFAIAAALNIDEFNLGGHDWGSAVVQEMALMQPKPILKLILINMMIINHGSGKKKAAQTLGKNMFRSSWYQFFQIFYAFLPRCIALQLDYHHQQIQSYLVRQLTSSGDSTPVPSEPWCHKQMYPHVGDIYPILLQRYEQTSCRQLLHEFLIHACHRARDGAQALNHPEHQVRHVTQ